MARDKTTAAPKAPAITEVKLPEPVEEYQPRHQLAKGDVLKVDEHVQEIDGYLQQVADELEAATVDSEQGAKHLDAIVKNLRAAQAQLGTAHKRFGWIAALLLKAEAKADREAKAEAKRQEREAAAAAKAAKPAK